VVRATGMRLLTRKEIAGLSTKMGRPTANSRLYEQLYSLSIGETVLLTKAEWRAKSPLYAQKYHTLFLPHITRRNRVAHNPH
jgi:hypothetical protein